LAEPSAVRHQLLIELATTADAAALRDLHVLTWAHTNAPLVPQEFQAHRLSQHRVRDWRELIAAQAAQGGGVLVARSGPELVGFCQYGPSPDEEDRGVAVGHIHRLYIHPGAQGRGVGRALLEHAVNRLSSTGARDLTLWVLENDPRARGFYERLGWRPDGTRRFDGVWDVRYRRAPVHAPA
jgi:ribosomal protein S18 acetylase RimI-like enzyme